MARRACAICGGALLETVIELPEFPEVGVFVDASSASAPRRLDQALEICAWCAHLQLRIVSPPEEIYGESYAHRSTVSHIAVEASDTFTAYVDELGRGRQFRQTLEIGCNDLLLLEKLAPRAKRLTGIDPIWKGRTPVSPPSGMTIIGDYAENVDWAEALEEQPDLIVSTHNLEHIVDPVSLLRGLLSIAADDCLFVIEVPDTDSLIDHLRFDQIFHQHLHYFTLHGFLTLLDSIGARYLDHRYNHRNWGGSFTVAFEKGARARGPGGARRPSADRIRERYSLFRERMQSFRRVVEGLRCDVYGYGAGQMVPSVAYHLGTDLGFLVCILDDNPSRVGLSYPGLPVAIRAADDCHGLQQAAVMIAALDAVVPIMQRLRALRPRHVLVPSDVY